MSARVFCRVFKAESGELSSSWGVRQRQVRGDAIVSWVLPVMSKPEPVFSRRSVVTEDQRETSYPYRLCLASFQALSHCVFSS